MKKELSALALGLMLAGCGGSGGSKKEEPPQGVTPPPQTPMVTADVVYYSPKCSIERPATDVRFVVHSQDGDILREEQPDVQGKVEIDWDDGESHLSIISMPISSDGDTSTDIHTDVALSKGDLGKISIIDRSMDSQCECSDFQIDVEELRSVYNDDYRFVINDPSSTTDLFERVEACKINGVFEPLLLTVLHRYDSSLPSFAAKIDLEKYKTIGTVNLFVNDLVRGETLDVILDSDVERVYSLANDEFGTHFLSQFDTPTIFDELYDNFYIDGMKYNDFHEDISSSISHRSVRRFKVTNSNETINVTVPDNSVAMLAKTYELLEALSSDSPTSVDFSSLNGNYDRVYASLTGDDTANWTMIAPIEGVIPALTLPEDIKAQFETTSSRFYLSVIDYSAFDGNINQLRELQAERSRSTGDKWPQYLENLAHERILITSF